MHIHKYQSPQEATQALAEAMVEKINAAIAEHEECTLVLSGGNSPRELYNTLSGAVYADRVDWSRVYFFFGDERFVPDSSDEYNGKMAREALFEPLYIPISQIYYIDTKLSPEECAKDYARKIKLHFGHRPIRFNIVLLGLGEDGHTASLFPNTSILKEEKALVAAIEVKKLHAWRISMTAPLINESEWISFLAFGEAKRKAFEAVTSASGSADEYPARLISPEDGELHWYVDEAASPA